MYKLILAVVSIIFVCSCTYSPGLYIDKKNDFSVITDNYSELIHPPIVFTTKMNVGDEIMYRNCKNDDVGLSALIWEEVQVINNLFDYYEYLSLSSNHYSDANGTEEYIKLKRINIVGPYQSLDKDLCVGLSFKEIKKKEIQKSLFGPLGLEGKLYKEIQSCNGDAVIDICLYYKDYKIIEHIREGDYLVKIYETDLMLSATIIKFKNDFYPEKKYLIKLSEKKCMGKIFLK